MKKCPYCAEQIQEEALICRFCQRAVGDSSTPVTLKRDRPVEKRKTSFLTWVVAAFFGLIFMGWCANVVSPTPDSTASAPPASQAAHGQSSDTSTPAGPEAEPLELLSSRGYNEYGYHHVEGQVRNASNSSMRNVAVVVTWYTKDDQLVKSDDAMIDFNPILPGQTSPFKALTTSNPAMSKYSVQFKELFGGTIPTKDLRTR